MKSTGTHFEQVPKAIVEKILAKQIDAPEANLTQRAVPIKPSVRGAQAPALRSRKV